MNKKQFIYNFLTFMGIDKRQFDEYLQLHTDDYAKLASVGFASDGVFYVNLADFGYSYSKLDIDELTDDVKAFVSSTLDIESDYIDFNNVDLDDEGYLYFNDVNLDSMNIEY